MKFKKFLIILLSIITFSNVSFAFEHKEINSFKKLSDFKTVEEFEKYYNDYTKECLDKGFGGAGSIPCFVASELWDRELNIYYKKLYNKLEANEKILLKNSQKKWLETRDLTIELNSILLNKNSGEGTMYLLMKAGDRDSIISPIIKQRALILKKWYELSHLEIE